MEQQPSSSENIPQHEHHEVNIEGVLSENKRDPDEIAAESRPAAPKPEVESIEEQYARKLEAIRKTKGILSTMPDGSAGQTTMKKALREMEEELQIFVTRYGKPILPEGQEKED